MSINEPHGRWVVVPQYLKGTDPTQSSFRQDVTQLFQRGQFGGFTVADFFAVQSLGAIDATNITVLPWAETAFDIYNHPGQQAGVDRRVLADNAKGLVTDGQPFRGVLAVYNYVCSMNNVDADVVWSLGGFGSVPAWASAWLHQCRRCQAMVTEWTTATICAAGPGGHDPTGSWSRTYMSVTDPKVPMIRRVALCARCDVLFADDRAADPTVPDECPAGGQHQPARDVLVLSGWADPPGEMTWTVCKRCRGVVANGSMSCPADPGGHTPEKQSNVHFPFLEFNYQDAPPRAWLIHEMSHGYGYQQLPGFVHGRGLGARTGDLADDCWPGAYGDRSDVMSYANVDPATPRAGQGQDFGVFGPGWSITQLVRGEVLDPAQPPFQPQLSPATPSVVATLRPALGAAGAGHLGARFGDHLVEYRQKKDWDAGLSVGSHLDPATGRQTPDPGVLLVRHVPQDPNRLPNLVPTVRANAFLGSSDRLESRVGIDNVAVEIVGFAADGSAVDVRFSSLPAATQAEDSGTITVPPDARASQRWLVIPYAASDSTATFSRDNASAILAAAEQFWTEMADEKFFVAGGDVLWPDKGPDDSPFRLHGYTVVDKPALPPDPKGHKKVGTAMQADVASLQQLSSATRAAVVIDQVLRTPNATAPQRVLPIDLRWYTGLVLLSLDGLGDGLIASLTLPSGIVPHTQDCNSDDAPDLLGPLPFDVIELPVSTLSQARLAREIGHSIGFADGADTYSLTGPDAAAQRFLPGPSTFGDSSWGQTGPSVSTGELKRRGWLWPWSTWSPDLAEQSQAAGSVTIYPFGRPGHDNPVRAEIGPFAFELRTGRWDSGLGGPVVLAYDFAAAGDELPLPLHPGDPAITWGGPIPQLSGGGSVAVSELDADHATLVYSIIERPIFQAGGGSLHGGGTVLIGADGSVHRIPPGDPVEADARALIEQLTALAGHLEH